MLSNRTGEELETDAEQQEDDPQFAEEQDHIIEHQPAETVRTGDQADTEVAEDRRQAQSTEQRDGHDGDRQKDQDVVEYCVFHARSAPTGTRRQRHARNTSEAKGSKRRAAVIPVGEACLYSRTRTMRKGVSMRTLLLTLLLLVFSLPAHAADRFDFARGMPQWQSGLPFGGPPVQGAKWRFCCQERSRARACHASQCSNCMSFCSGDMVIDPQTQQRRMPPR